jgi:aspartyl-tRNA(Asn)/glutamyl-tRNA(Gln) amidotransferase subunit C
MPLLWVKRIFHPRSQKNVADRAFDAFQGDYGRWKHTPPRCNVRTADTLVKRIAFSSLIFGGERRPFVLDTPIGGRLTTDMDAAELTATARMARLALSADEMENLGKAVEQMLAHFSHMREIDVEGLAPTTHALLKENRLREDAVDGAVSTDALLGNAPEREERYIVIPNVL